MFTQEIKDTWTAKMQGHQDADRFVQGDWLDRYRMADNDGSHRGLFFGCSMQTKNSPLEKAAEEMATFLSI